MNPYISELFEEIDELEEELEYYSKHDMCHQAHFKRYQIAIIRQQPAVPDGETLHQLLKDCQDTKV